MCGIFGYIGFKDSAKVCVEGLKFLEYRGYDSSGVAGVSDGEIVFCKETGKIAALEASIETLSKDLTLAISHTRWATHGKPSKDNAHPHFDEKKTIALVHNGIIENHGPLRQMLVDKGYHFYSETDTEVIAQLVSYYYKGDFLAAVQRALADLKGFWALAVIHTDHPETIITASRENPLAIGLSQARMESYLSSDVNAFQAPDLDVIFLRSDEVAVITKGEVKVYDALSSPVSTNFQRWQVDMQKLSKDGFSHYMLKEIFEQPSTLRQAMHGRFLDDLGTVEFDDFSLSCKELAAVKRITILGCGTSWHAACIAATLLEEKARIPAQAEIASEYRYKNPIVNEDTLVIAISQSGETLDTIAAVRELRAKGAKVLAVCNVRSSTLTREADGCLYLRAGPEISVCSTKAFTSQLTVLTLFTILMARLRHMTKEEGQQLIRNVQELPAKVEKILASLPLIQKAAKDFARYDHFFFLGRHYMYPTSLEAALKLKEISYLHATGYPAGEMKHGPLALVSEELAVVGLLGNHRTQDKSLSNLMEAKARGARILVFAFEGAKDLEDISTDVLYLPSCPDELASILFSVATQLFAYFVALERGTDIDQPRNLAKSVTVE